MRLRLHALIIAAVTLLPLLAFACFVIFLLFQNGRDSQMQNLVETARDLSLAVDRDSSARISALKTLGMIMGGFIILLTVAYGFAVLYGRRIFFSITALSEGAKTLASGGVPRFEPSSIFELNEVRRELVSAAEQRTRTEGQLRYELQLVRNISDKAVESIFVVDANGLVTFVNPEAEKTFGFSSAELTGQTLHEKIHHHYPDGRPMPRSECTLAKLRLSGESVRARDDVFFRKDGSPVSVNCTNAPIEVDGARVGAVLIARDVTEAKRAEEMLRKSEAGLAEAQARAKLGSWERNLANDIGTWSAEMFRLFERDPSEGVPKLDEFFAMLHGEDRPRVQEAVARVAGAKKQVSLEFRSNPALGPIRHFSSTIYSFENADRRAVLLGGTVQDITERRRSEEAVRGSEERLKLAMAAAHMGAWERNVKTDEIFWSPECREIIGVEKFGGTRDAFRNLMHPEDAHRTLEAADLAIANRQDFTSEFRIIRPGGDIVWLAANARTHYDETGQPARVIGTIQDITERKQLLAEVQRRSEQLIEADQRKDEFLAMLAHELRNPLAPITSAVEILRLQGTPSPEWQWATDVIDKQMEHMIRLIDDLLDVSRITRNKLELRKERVEVSQIVQTALDTAGPVIEQFGHDLSVALSPKPIYLDADPVRLAQVLSNLLNNAAKYTDRGGSIILAVERVEGAVVISIKDSGIGIPKDRLAEVFELFSQVDPLLERARGGLGIGLNLARRLVELHGGSIEAGSEGSGKGSKFMIRLPIAVDASKAEEEISAAAGVGSGSDPTGAAHL
jgi:PAS domain S-box-containing protein